MVAISLRILYREVMQESDSFKDIRPEVLTRNPRRLLVFRLFLNLDQRSIGKLLGKSQGTVWFIENGYIKTINKDSAVRIVELAKKIRTVPNYEDLSARSMEITKRGRFYGQYAKKMSERASKDKSIRSAVSIKPTRQEALLVEELTKKQVDFKLHGVIDAERKFVVDFVFPSEGNPRLILEMKDLQKDYRKRLLAIDLAYRSLKIRKYHPDVRMIAAINGKLQNDALEIVKSEYDKVLQNASPVEVLRAINSYIGSTV